MAPRLTSETNKVGMRYTRLLVVEEYGRSPRGAVLYKCKCDCGKETITAAAALVSGGTKSCGCYARDRSTKHGHSRGNKGRTPEYACWRNMLSRCTNPNVGRYPDYGGRGIKVCERWSDFRNFLADMGPMPKSYSIERRDNNGNYEPDNCYWLLKKLQSKNRRGNHRIALNGAEYCLSEACRVLGVSLSAIEHRIYDHKIPSQEVINSIVNEQWSPAPYKRRRQAGG